MPPTQLQISTIPKSIQNQLQASLLLSIRLLPWRRMFQNFATKLQKPFQADWKQNSVDGVKGLTDRLLHFQSLFLRVSSSSIRTTIFANRMSFLSESSTVTEKGVLGAGMRFPWKVHHLGFLHVGHLLKKSDERFWHGFFSGNSWLFDFFTVNSNVLQKPKWWSLKRQWVNNLTNWPPRHPSSCVVNSQAGFERMNSSPSRWSPPWPQRSKGQLERWSDLSRNWLDGLITIGKHSYQLCRWFNFGMNEIWWLMEIGNSWNRIWFEGLSNKLWHFIAYLWRRAEFGVQYAKFFWTHTELTERASEKLEVDWRRLKRVAFSIGCSERVFFCDTFERALSVVDIRYQHSTNFNQFRWVSLFKLLPFLNSQYPQTVITLPMFSKLWSHQIYFHCR